MTLCSKTALQIVISSKKLFRQLCYKSAKVHKGTGYPSRHTPIGAMVYNRCTGCRNVYRNIFEGVGHTAATRVITGNHHMAISAVKWVNK